MKRIFPSSTFVFLITAFLCGHTNVIASNKPETLLKQQKSRTAFIENKGQIIDQSDQPNPAVLYLLNTPGMNVQLRKGGFSYDVYRATSPSPLLLQEKGLRDEVNINKHYQCDFHRIDFFLEDCDPAYPIIPSNPSNDYLNYYTPGTPEAGITNVRKYGSVTYKDVYPGIDLSFIIDDKTGFKYNFLVHPGADISTIRIFIKGADEIDELNGHLVLATSLGTIEEAIPRSTCHNGMSEQPVQCRFKELSKGIYGIVADRDIPLNATLLIDPVPIRLWGTYYGGTDLDNATSIKTDQAGNIYMAGYTSSANNIATTGAFQTTISGSQDGLLTRFTSSGELVWGTYYGGEGFTNFGYLSISSDGSLYVGGQTNSTTVIATPGTHQVFYGGGWNDGFLVKFNGNGNRIWGTYYGGSASDEIHFSIADGKWIYICGNTTSTDLIATSGAFQTMLKGFQDAFLAKFDSSGQCIWGTYFGGSLTESGQAVNIMNHTIVLLGGNTTSQDVIATTGTQQFLYGGGTDDGFLERFDTSGQRIWGTYFGGSGSDGVGMCLPDTAGYIYLLGFTSSPNNISTSGCHQFLYGGGPEDGYIEKYDTNGMRQWGTYYGGSGDEAAGGAAIDDSNFLYFTGRTSSLDNIATPDAYQPSYGGSTDSYLVKFSSSGNRIWGTYYGGASADVGNDVAVKGEFQYLAGHTLSSNAMASAGAHQTDFAGIWDGFIARFTDCPVPDTASVITGPLSICGNLMGVIYSVPVIGNANGYEWSFPPGIIPVSGQNTNTITVDFTTGSTSGFISVKGVNTCGKGDSSLLFVTVKPVPVPSINGPDSSCLGEVKNYSAAPGKLSYQWSVSLGGSITSGGGNSDDHAWVQWTTFGLHWVGVNYTDTNGCTAAQPTHFNVVVFNPDSVKVQITASANNVCTGTSVTFTAVITNGGTSPTFQWKVNGNNAGGNSPNYTYNPGSGDLVSCILTSSSTICISNNPATSNTIQMIVNPLNPVSITISPSANPICSGTAVTYFATPVNGGSSPFYQWKVNGANVGTNSLIYTYTPINGDIVKCVLTSNILCPSGNPATSNTVTMIVNPNLPVSVSISASANPFCQGSAVTFTATPTNGGTLPSYQWKVNAINVGPNNIVYTYIPVSGDLVLCILTSNIACPTGNPATSNTITMIQNNNLLAGVSIVASSNPFCPGNSVTFTATPFNGGTNPSYQWKVNGVNVGINSSTYSYYPIDGDSVRCVMTSNLSCVTGNPASSAKIILSGTLAPIVTFTSCFDTITTINAKPIKLKGGIPLGGIYSGPGVNSLTGIFTPALAGVGTHTITYTYTNAAMCSAFAHTHIINYPLSIVNCGNPITDIRDNKIYQTVQIGTQCWLATNLNYGTILTSSQDQRDNCQTEKYCYNDNPINCTNQGGLYQWDKLMLFDETPADQGFCPPGWHIPTENEWNTLFANYINSGFAGSPLKYSGYSGFNALLSGAKHINKGWDFQGFATFFWSSTLRNSTQAWAHGMNETNPSVSVYPSSRVNAFSVRCLKD